MKTKLIKYVSALFLYAVGLIILISKLGLLGSLGIFAILTAFRLEASANKK